MRKHLALAGVSRALRCSRPPRGLPATQEVRGRLRSGGTLELQGGEAPNKGKKIKDFKFLDLPVQCDVAPRRHRGTSASPQVKNKKFEADASTATRTRNAKLTSQASSRTAAAEGTMKVTAQGPLDPSVGTLDEDRLDRSEGIRHTEPADGLRTGELNLKGELKNGNAHGTLHVFTAPR